MSERDLRQKELQTYNPYNTRGPNMNGKIIHHLMNYSLFQIKMENYTQQKQMQNI